jgi:long-subunit fatty acid transport protein
VPYLFTRINEGAETLKEDGLSDVTLELKWRFYEKGGLSFALKPGITLPTGEEDTGLGDGEAAYSLHFLSSKELDPVTIHLDLGYIKNRKELRNIWHYSLAAEYAVSKPLALVANIGGETNPDRESNVHPLFLLGGMIYTINENFSVDLGLKTGLNKAEADYTVLAGIIIDF